MKQFTNERDAHNGHKRSIVLGLGYQDQVIGSVIYELNQPPLI